MQDYICKATDNAFLFTKIKEVLNFAINNITRIRSGCTGSDEIYVANVKWSDKIVAETLILLLLLFRNVESRQSFLQEIDLLCKLIIPLSRTPLQKIEILKTPRMVLPFAYAHILLNTLGYFDEEFNYIVANAISSEKLHVSERISFREMDLKWGLSLFDPSLGLDLKELSKLSILERNASIMDMCREDEYAFTHSIFYTTDFGTLPLPENLNSNKINNIIDGCLAKNILVEDIDLLGEFLICSIITKNTESIYFETGLHYYITVWDSLGFLPGPTFNKEEYIKLTGEEATSYVYKHIYHTYYVGGILCTILYNFNAKSNIVSHGTNGSPLYDRSLKDLQSKLKVLSANAFKFCKQNFEIGGVKDKIKVFQKHKKESEPSETLFKYLSQHAHLHKFLATFSIYDPQFKKFVFDTYLIEAVRNNNLPALVDLILDIIDCEIPPTYTFFEALNFLTRQELQSGSMSGFFFIDCEVSENTRCLFELKIAYCLSKVAAYLEKFTTVKNYINGINFL